jgi:hypothetical protein
MLVDDDMEFTPDAVDCLRSNDYGYDVMSCLCVTRKRSHVPLVITGRNPETLRPQLAKHEDIRGVVPVEYVGFGGVIIKRWVLEKVQALYHPNPAFAFDELRGEDGRFSDDVRRVGGKIAVNTDVKFGHRTSVALYWNKEAQALDFSENDYGLGIMQEEQTTQEKQ